MEYVIIGLLVAIALSELIGLKKLHDMGQKELPKNEMPIEMTEITDDGK